MDTKLDCEVPVDVDAKGPADIVVCREGRDGW